MRDSSKAIILARVSSKAQEDEGYSLDSQLKLMRGYCKTNKLTIDREFKIAETASKEQRRKVFHELIKYIGTHNKVKHLIVEKTDRLARNFKDAIVVDAWLEKDDTRRLHMVKESLVVHKNARSDAKFMWNIYLSVAKKYTDNLREEAMKGWAEKLAQGWLPAEPPPGYMTVHQGGKKIHVVNPEIYKQMARIFRLALLPGYTRTRLSEEMALVGIMTKNKKPFSASQVTRILSNPFYIGINRMQGVDYPGAQETIIPRRLFYEVQEQIKAGHRERREIRKHNPIFKCMIRCAGCSAMISWSKQKGRFYGGCQRRRGKCTAGAYMREDRIEMQIIQQLEDIIDPKSKILSKIRDLINVTQLQDVGTYRDDMIDDLSRQVGRLQKMESRLYDDKLAGLITQERYEEKRDVFSKEVLDISDRLTMLREVQNANVPVVIERQSENPIVDLYLGSSPAQKRVIMSFLFKPMVANADKVTIEFA